MNRVTEQFNQWLDEASRQYPSGSTENLALLVGMNITSELLELKVAHYDLYYSEQRAHKENERLREALDHLKDQFQALKEENQTLQEQLEEKENGQTEAAPTTKEVEAPETAAVSTSKPDIKEAPAPEAEEETTPVTETTTEEEMAPAPEAEAKQTALVAEEKADSSSAIEDQANVTAGEAESVAEYQAKKNSQTPSEATEEIQIDVTKSTTTPKTQKPSIMGRPTNLGDAIFVDMTDSDTQTQTPFTPGHAKSSMANRMNATGELLKHYQQSKQHTPKMKGLSKTPRKH